MFRFLWHWLFHGMRPAYEHLAQDMTAYYLCKCGKAFTVTRGWREDRKWFTDIEEATTKQIEEIKKFLIEAYKDMQTL